MQIEPKILERLKRNIDQLLNARWDTGRITAALSAEQSFGKHLGCTPDAIRALAIAQCKAINAETLAVEREIVARARKSLPPEFAHLANHFKFRSK